MVDGGTFKTSGPDADASEGDARRTVVPVAAGSAGTMPVESIPSLAAGARDSQAVRRWRDHLGRALSLLAAVGLHAALIAGTLLQGDDSPGDAGTALETVAVSLVGSVPVYSAPAPETPVAERDQPQDTETPPVDEAVSEPAEASPTPTDKPETEQPPENAEPRKQALALDLPPEPVPPPPEAIALPAREPERERDPEPVLRDEQPPERKDEVKPAQPPPQPDATPPASAVMPQVTMAEAAPGVVRAYAGALSKVLDRRKPRSRGLRGMVRVQFVVDPVGRPEGLMVLASSGSEKLDELVLEAIRTMEFPAPPPEMSLRQRTFNVPFAFR
jgi:TonB family protein